MTLREWSGRLSWGIVACALALIVVGLSGIARGDALVGEGTYAARQAVWVALAVPVLFAATGVPYRLMRHIAWPLFGVSLVLLVAVYFMPARNGAHSWIPLGSLTFQPS